MIETELNKYISEQSSARPVEQKGRTVGIQLVAGETVIGKLIEHRQNYLVVEDWRENGLLKEIHRAIVARLMIVVQGGKDNGGSGTTNKRHRLAPKD